MFGEDHLRPDKFQLTFQTNHYWKHLFITLKEHCQNRTVKSSTYSSFWYQRSKKTVSIILTTRLQTQPWFTTYESHYSVFSAYTHSFFISKHSECAFYTETQTHTGFGLHSGEVNMQTGAVDPAEELKHMWGIWLALTVSKKRAEATEWPQSDRRAQHACLAHINSVRDPWEGL